MKIGIPKEIKNNEYRVGITPEYVHLLTQNGHKVYVENKAGEGSGYTNDDYNNAGATILQSASEVYSISEMIVKVKEPQPAEYDKIQKGQIIFTYFHFASSLSLTQAMLASQATCIAYETVRDENHKLPLLTPMSEVAGRMSVQQAAKYLEKPQGGKGKLLGGVAGVSPAKVLILGGGVVGTEAAKMAAGLGAQVVLLDINLDRLRYLNEVLPKNVSTLFSNPDTIKKHLPSSDIVIGAVLVPGAKAPKLIQNDMLNLLEKESVLVDVAIDQGGCFESSKPTTHENPIYTVNGITHYCVANIPGAVPQTSTLALNNVTFPYIKTIADNGWRAGCKKQQSLLYGVSMVDGDLYCPDVGKSFNLPTKNQYDLV